MNKRTIYAGLIIFLLFLLAVVLLLNQNQINKSRGWMVAEEIDVASDGDSAAVRKEATALKMKLKNKVKPEARSQGAVYVKTVDKKVCTGNKGYIFLHGEYVYFGICRVVKEEIIVR